jgi:hypothetical protein
MVRHVNQEDHVLHQLKEENHLPLRFVNRQLAQGPEEDDKTSTGEVAREEEEEEEEEETILQMNLPVADTPILHHLPTRDRL